MATGDRMQAMTIKELRNKYTSSNVRWGRAKSQCLSTELDSSTIIITNSDKLNIESYDIVELTNEYNSKEYWLVADKKEEYITFTSPFKYQYTIELMSLTKLFETIFLPSMTITNIGQNRTIYTYIYNAVTRYFKTSYNFNITFSSGLNALTSNVVAKEHTFSEPTLREYIDWLLSSVGAICTLKMIKSNGVYSFVLDYLKLSSAPSQIGGYITNITTGQDSDSYVSRILQTSDDIISQQTIKEYLKESTTEPILNTDTAQLRLTRKAYDFKSLKALNVSFDVRVKYANTTGADSDASEYSGTMDVDISDFVVPTEEYSTLTRPNSSEYGTTGFGSRPKAFYTVTPNKYITNDITWDRDSNTITNLHYMQKWKVWWTDFNSGVSIENAIRRKVWEWYKTIAPDSSAAKTWPDGRIELKIDDGHGFVQWFMYYVDIDYDYDEQLFEVEYQPYFSPKIVEEHEKSNAIYSTDTNTNAKTDILLQLDRNKEKLNQLACDYKIMTAISKVTNNDYTPKISVGQYWMDENNNKYVLTKLETAVNPSFIQYKGTLSLNFSNAIIDTSLNREKRYYAYANTEIVTRKENQVKTFKICLTSSQGNEKPLIPADSCRVSFSYNQHPIGYYLLPIVKVYNDRMISFEIQTMDNISITSVKGDSITGGYQNKVLKYVNDDGEFDRVHVDFGVLKSESTTDVEGQTPIEWASGIDIDECGEEQTISGAVTIWIDESENLFYALTESVDINNVLKDNREQFNLTVQYIPKTSVDISNSTAYFNAFYFDRYLDNLKQYYEAVNASDNPSSLAKPFKWELTWLSGRTQPSSTTRQGNVSLSELFSTNFMSIYQASGGQYANDDNIRLRILCNYSGNYAIDIRNYKGGYLTPSYEDFI